MHVLQSTCCCWAFCPIPVPDKIIILHRSVDSPSGGDSQPSPFRQWYQGQEPWWAKNEEEQTQNAQSEIGESEADTDIGSTSPDGPHHSRSGRGRYYYLLVTQLTFA